MQRKYKSATNKVIQFITNSLRMAKKYLVPFAKSTRFQKSFIPYALANFQ